MYLGVTPFRRFAIYLIDIGLISVVASLILLGVLYLSGYNFERYNQLSNNISTYYLDLLLGKSNYLVSQEGLNEVYEFIGLYFIREGIRLLIMLVLTVVYLVILPYFFNYQTLGRLATNSKVIDNKNIDGKLSIGKLVLREIVGTFLFYSVLPFVGFISMILAIATGKSLVDRVSNTSMVIKDKIPVNEEFNANFFTNKEEYNEYSHESDDSDSSYQEPEDVKKDYIDVEPNDVSDENTEDDDGYRVI